MAYAFGNLFICNESYKITILKSLTYFGCFVSNFTLAYFTDRYGRKFSMVVSWGIALFGLFIIAISWNIYIAGLGLFLLGLGQDQAQSIGINLFY